MPSKSTMRRARQDRKEGKSPSTQAGEFVKEEMEHAKKGKHPVKSRKQAVAIGLSKARRAGVKIPAKGKAKSTSKGSRTGASKARSGSRKKTSRAKSSSSRTRTKSRKK